MGEFTVALTFRNVKDDFSWALRAFMGLILTVIESIYDFMGGNGWLE